MIFMSNPLHGFTNAYSNEEAAELEKLGWKRDVFKPKAQILAEAAEAQKISPIPNHIGEPAKIEPIPNAVGEAPIVELSLAEQYEAKFGKPPHHRMAQATIEAALKE